MNHEDGGQYPQQHSGHDDSSFFYKQEDSEKQIRKRKDHEQQNDVGDGDNDQAAGDKHDEIMSLESMIGDESAAY